MMKVVTLLIAILLTACLLDSGETIMVVNKKEVLGKRSKLKHRQGLVRQMKKPRRKSKPRFSIFNIPNRFPSIYESKLTS